MASFLEGLGGEAGTTVGQHVGHPEKKSSPRGLEEIDRVFGVLGVVGCQMNVAGAAVDSDVEITLAHLSVRGSQFRQVFYIDMDIAQVINP